MTRIQYIDCKKWERIIGITLWSLATIGLFYGLYALVSYSLTQSAFRTCIEYYSNGITVNTTCQVYSGIDVFAVIFAYALALLGNVGNVCSIWYVLNSHYRWLEIKCGSKPEDEEGDKR